jgi:AcrR family transcriptional regulator
MAGTRDRLALEAARLFAERGFHGASVDDIGAACGISGPAVYKHFASKTDLLAELLRGISVDLLAGGEAAVAEAKRPEAALDALLARHIEFSVSRPDLIRVQDRDLASLSEADHREVRRLQRAYIEVWATVLVDDRQDLTLDQARIRVRAVFGLLNSTPHLTQPRGGREAVVQELTAMARAALLS